MMDDDADANGLLVEGSKPSLPLPNITRDRIVNKTGFFSMNENTNPPAAVVHLIVLATVTLSHRKALVWGI